jgi:hypothetical protein
MHQTADTQFRTVWCLFSDAKYKILVGTQQAEISNNAATFVVVQTFVDRWQTVTSQEQRQNECNALYEI